MAFLVVYITYPNMDEARKVVSHLLEKRLIACANLYPIESIYWWNGTLEESLEIVSLLKTRKENWAKIKSEVEKIHPYDVPCIMRFEAQANSKYNKWVNTETKR